MPHELDINPYDQIVKSTIPINYYPQITLVFLWGILSLGSVIKMQAWSLRQLVTQFGRSARRPHVPREAAMRSLYVAADVPLPVGI